MREEAGGGALLGALYTYPLGEVESCNAQRPETAEHGEESESQVVPGRQGEEGIFTLTLAGGSIALQESEVCWHHSGSHKPRQADKS